MAVDDTKQIAAVGITVATSATAASAAIPNTFSGTLPKFVRIQVTQYSYIKFGSTAGVTATNNDILISPNEPEVFTVAGNTYISVLQHGSSGVVNITALENC